MKYKVKLLLGSPFLDTKRKSQSTEGSTLFSALNKLKSKELMMTNGTLEVEYGDKKANVPMTVQRLRRLFNPRPVYRELLAKNIMYLLK